MNRALDVLRSVAALVDVQTVGEHVRVTVLGVPVYDTRWPGVQRRQARRAARRAGRE